MINAGKHIEKHKHNYMFAGILLSALLHTLNGVTFKMFLFGLITWFSR